MENVHLASNVIDTVTAHDASAEAVPRLAAERIEAELAAMPDADILQVNVDVDAAVTHVLGHWKGLEPYLPQIARLPDFDASPVPKLRDYASALHYWHSRAQYAGAAPAGLAEMIDRGIATRDRIVAMLEALAKFGVIVPSALSSFKGTSGHHKLARDLTALSGFVHENWSALAGKSLLSLEEMHEVAHLGYAILEAIGDRDASPTSKAFAIRQRDKTFTLLARAHDQARRALLFLRWEEGDADTIMPSIYSGRRTGKKREGATELAPKANEAAAPKAMPFGGTQSSLLVADGADEDDDA